MWCIGYDIRIKDALTRFHYTKVPKIKDNPTYYTTLYRQYPVVLKPNGITISDTKHSLQIPRRLEKEKFCLVGRCELLPLLLGFLIHYEEQIFDNFGLNHRIFSIQEWGDLEHPTIPHLDIIPTFTIYKDKPELLIN